MKKISYWAKENKGKARLLIGFIQLFQMLSAVFIGLSLFANDVFIHKGWEIALSITVIGTVIIYPMERKNNYNFRKTCDGLLVYGIFFLTIVLANQLPAKLGIDNLAEAPQVSQEHKARFMVFNHKDNTYSPPVSQEKNINKKPRSERKAEKKELKRKFKAELRKLRADDDKIGLLVALSTLLVVCCILLGLALAAMICQLSCAGGISMGVVLIGLLSLLGVIGLGVGIEKVNRDRKKNKNEDEDKDKDKDK